MDMKSKLLRSGIAAAGIACCAVIISCVCKGPGSGDGNTIVFEEDRVFIPGNEISAEDQAAMDKVLQQFDKSLYRVQTYKAGQNVKTTGALGRMFLPLVAVQQVIENAKLHSLTGSAIQAGRGFWCNSQELAAGTRPGGSKFATPSPPPKSDEVESSAHLALRITGQKFRYNDKELVRQLRPILEKYNRR